MFENPLSFGQSAAFVAMSIGLLLAQAWIYRRERELLKFLLPCELLWLACTGALAASGILAKFSSPPPLIPLLVILQSTFLLWLVFFSRFQAALVRADLVALVGIQSFRLPVEILLSSLAVSRLIPIEMTFHGRNFDALTAVSAILLLFWIGQSLEVEKVKRILWKWNFLGLGLVTNVVVMGMLSAPYPFQLLHLEIANRAIAYFPAIWLPCFLVPSAYFYHFVLWKKLV